MDKVVAGGSIRPAYLADRQRRRRADIEVSPGSSETLSPCGFSGASRSIKRVSSFRKVYPVIQD